MTPTITPKRKISQVLSPILVSLSAGFAPGDELRSEDTKAQHTKSTSNPSKGWALASLADRLPHIIGGELDQSDLNLLLHTHIFSFTMGVRRQGLEPCTPD